MAASMTLRSSSNAAITGPHADAARRPLFELLSQSLSMRTHLLECIAFLTLK
jgi:hypothetical protein